MMKFAWSPIALPLFALASFFCAFRPVGADDPGKKVAGGGRRTEDRRTTDPISREKKEVEAWLHRGRRSGFYPSAAVGVLHKGELVYEYYPGGGRSRRYGLASITKTFTGLAVLQLVARGKIRLSDPVSRYLPRLKIAEPGLNSKPVEIRHLLSHTAGFADERSFKNPARLYPAQTGLPFSIPRQVYPAGVNFSYSNTNFIVLGAVVEAVAGMPLREYLQTRIFDPLAMSDTRMTKRLTGAYGITITLPDLAGYAGMWLRRGRTPEGKILLEDHVFRQIFRPVLYFPGKDRLAFMGLSWRVERSGDEVFTFYHVGGAKGIMAWIQMFPRQNAAIMYLGNPRLLTPAVLAHLVELRTKLARLAWLYANPREPYVEFRPSLPDNELLQKLAGEYRSPTTKKRLEMRYTSGRLYQLRGRQEFPLQPLSTRTFRNRKTWHFYDFLFDWGKSTPFGLATDRDYFIRLMTTGE